MNDTPPELTDIQKIMLANLQSSAEGVMNGSVTSLAIITGRTENFDVQFAGNNFAGLFASTHKLAELLMKVIFPDTMPKAAKRSTLLEN